MKYEFLRQRERRHRRTINDAIAVFEEELHVKAENAFASGFTAKVQVSNLGLPWSDTVSVVSCIFTNAAMERSFVVPIATSSTFRAAPERVTEHQSFDIFQLNDAEIFSSGDLRLTDGMRLRAVEVVPTPLPYNPTDLERRIISFTVRKTGEIDRCYPSLFASLPPDLSEGLPDIRMLDYSTFAESKDRPRLKIPALKVIRADFLKENDDIKSLSLQKVSDALTKAGLFIPIRRRKRKIPLRP